MTEPQIPPAVTGYLERFGVLVPGLIPGLPAAAAGAALARLILVLVPFWVWMRWTNQLSGIPFYTTPQGRGVIEEDHRLSFLGARNQAWKEADVVLIVGTRMNFIIGFGQAPRWAEADVEATRERARDAAIAPPNTRFMVNSG